MARISANDITITSLETITCFHLTSGDYLFTIDELQNATIANTQDKTDITGKGGRKLNSLKRNKAVTVSGTNGLMSAGLYELQTGSKFDIDVATTIKWTDYLTVSENAATTTYKAVGTVGNEISKIFVKSEDGTIATALTQDATAGAGTFSYNPETKAISFNAGDVADGSEIVVYYNRKITGDVLANESDAYSEKCQMYIDAFGEDKCGNMYRVQFYIPKADFSGNFDIAMGGDQTVHAFEAESLSGACGAGGKLWTYTIFGTDTEDVVEDED